MRRREALAAIGGSILIPSVAYSGDEQLAIAHAKFVGQVQTWLGSNGAKLGTWECVDVTTARPKGATTSKRGEFYLLWERVDRLAPPARSPPVAGAAGKRILTLPKTTTDATMAPGASQYRHLVASLPGGHGIPAHLLRGLTYAQQDDVHDCCHTPPRNGKMRSLAIAALREYQGTAPARRLGHLIQPPAANCIGRT